MCRVLQSDLCLEIPKRGPQAAPKTHAKRSLITLCTTVAYVDALEYIWVVIKWRMGNEEMGNGET